MNTFVSQVDPFFKNVKFDKKLMKQIILFKLQLINKTEDHIRFYGGNLLGPDRIVWSDRDRQAFFKILKVDYHDLRDFYYTLDGINPEWEVSSDARYLTILYLVCKFDENLKKDSDYEKVVKALYVIFAFISLGSMYSNGFGNYPLNRKVAERTYEKMSKSFILKKEGSWAKFFDHRAKALLRPNGIWYERFKDMDPEMAGSAVADMQGRLKSTFLTIYGKIVETIEENKSAKETRLIGKDDEGEDTYKDTESIVLNFKNKIENNITDKRNFIHRDYIKIVNGYFKNLKEGLIIVVLEEVSDASFTKDFMDKKIVENIVSLSISYLNEINLDFRDTEHTEEVLYKLKNFWSTTNASRKGMVETKKEIENIVVKRYDKNTQWIISSLTVSVILYIFMTGLLHKG